MHALVAQRQSERLLTVRSQVQILPRAPYGDKMRKILAIAMLAVFVCGCIGQSGTDNTPTKGTDYTKTGDLVAGKGDTVYVFYTGRLVNGTIFDSNEGGNALVFTVGAGQMISGFDEAVLGMKINQTKTVSIPPEKAYGTSDHPLANQTLIFDIRMANIKKA